ncbi:MAG: hypothetical protein IPL61_38830 [Myxococcales bacterium]|nr:hypothetical protein [Myxococcales bacterium]
MSKLLSFVLLASVFATACPRTEGNPAKSETRLALARDFLLKNQLEAAEAEANKAIAYLNTNEEAYNLRGLVHHLRAIAAQSLVEVEGCLTGIDAEALRKEVEDELGLAEADFRKAVALAPEFGEAWSNAGTAALLLGDTDRALEAFDQALSNPARLVSPGLTRAHLGWAHFAKNDLVSAFRSCARRCSFSPGCAWQLIGSDVFTLPAKNGKKPPSSFRKLATNRTATRRRKLLFTS